jgi:Protein of unknown function (DUF2442)
MALLPRVRSAEYRGGFRLHLTFHDGTAGTVDFRRWLRGEVFEPLKDPAYFQQFFVDVETVAWPNGADIAPETLYDAARASRPAAPKASGARKSPAKKRSR